MANKKNYISEIKTIVGTKYVLDSKQDLMQYGTDWTNIYPPNPSFIVLPANTQEIAKVLAFCHEHSLAVVPSGGRTGLAGGAVASNQEIVLSLSRLQKNIWNRRDQHVH